MMRIVDRMIDFVSYPVPLRTVVVRKLLRRWPIGSYEARLRSGGVHRPNYAFCAYYAALEAKALGHSAVTVLELGVAGGNGLVNLCQHREDIRKALGIEVVVVGFDAESGLPDNRDLRNVQYFWPPGSFKMDRSSLEKRIAGRAQLVLGEIAETAQSWTPRPDAPLGAVMFDLDFYTSTMDAFALLTKENILPRVWCYFDDICGGPENAFTDSIGEREAIKQFNLSPERKILNDHLSPAYVFKHKTPDSWHQQIYLYHRLSHPEYNTCLYGKGERDQLSLRKRT
jgi:hypothetical protein